MTGASPIDSDQVRWWHAAALAAEVERFGQAGFARAYSDRTRCRRGIGGRKGKRVRVVWPDREPETFVSASAAAVAIGSPFTTVWTHAANRKLLRGIRIEYVQERVA